MEELLLVEPAETEENSLISDPSAYVSITAQTKDRMRKKIEEVNGGVVTPDYKFNNPASKVTLVDSNNGSNLVNEEYYNSVAMVGDKLFLAKNDAESDVVVFSIPERKIVEEKVTDSDQEIETAVIDNSEAVIEQPVEEATEVEANELSDIFGATKTVEAERVPIESSNNSDFSFDEITAETPDVEVDNGESMEITGDNYEHETEIEKSLEESNKNVLDNLSFLSQFESNNASKENNEKTYEFNYEFEPDTIDVSSIEDSNDDSIEEEKKIIDNATQILNNITNTMSAKDDQIRELQDDKDELSKENLELRNALKEAEIRKNQDALTISSLDDDNEELKTKLTKSEEEKEKLKAEIETLKTTADLYKRRDEESRRNIKTLVRAVNNFEIARGMTEEEKVKVRAA